MTFTRQVIGCDSIESEFPLINHRTAGGKRSNARIPTFGDPSHVGGFSYFARSLRCLFHPSSPLSLS